MSTVAKFWMIFRCPELQSIIFEDSTLPELKSLMLVNREFANTLRPLVWKTLKLYSPRARLPLHDVIIKNASLIRNLSTNNMHFFWILVTSGTCTRLKFLEVNRIIRDSSVEESDQDVWKLVRMNKQLECLSFSASRGKVVVFAEGPRSSLLMLPERNVNLETPLFQRTLVKISFCGIEFGQGHLNELANLCPNLTNLSIEFCKYTTGTDPFGGNRSWRPAKLTSLQFSPLKSSSSMDRMPQNMITLRFKNPLSNMEHMWLEDCDGGMLNVFQQWLINGLTCVQELMMFDSKSAAEVDENEIMTDVFNTAIVHPGLKDIYWNTIQLGPRSMKKLISSFHVQTLTSFWICECKGVKVTRSSRFWCFVQT